MKWARIDNGTVREVVDFDPSGKFHPSLVWAQCPDNVSQRYLYTGGSFFEPTVSLSEVKAFARKTAIAAARGVFSFIPTAQVDAAITFMKNKLAAIKNAATVQDVQTALSQVLAQVQNVIEGL